VDKQIIFDVVLFGIRAQGGPSMNGTGCVYRSATGRRCAVGMWIANDQYLPVMEGKRIAGLMMDFPDRLPSWFEQHKWLLSDLQAAHDAATENYDFMNDFEDRMRKLALVENLRYTHPEVRMPHAEEAYEQYCTQ